MKKKIPGLGENSTMLPADSVNEDLYYVSPSIHPLIYTISGVFMITIGTFGVFANLVRIG